MVAQTVLPFKLKSTDETLIAQGGLVLFGEYCQALGLRRWLDQALPAPGSGAGHAASDHALALVLMLHGGGRCLEDSRTLRADRGLRELRKLKVPSSDALGDWLRRRGTDAGLAGLREVQRRVLCQALSSSECRAHTLDIDATRIVAEKKTARRTYKGEIGYMPMLGHLAETGLAVGDEFRDGNVAPATRNLEFIRVCERNCRGGIGLRRSVPTARPTRRRLSITVKPAAKPMRSAPIAIRQSRPPSGRYPSPIGHLGATARLPRPSTA